MCPVLELDVTEWDSISSNHQGIHEDTDWTSVITR